MIYRILNGWPHFSMLTPPGPFKRFLRSHNVSRIHYSRDGCSGTTSEIKLQDVPSKDVQLQYELTDSEIDTLAPEDSMSRLRSNPGLSALFCKGCSNSGWWWEFGSILVSVTSMTLILAVLFTMNNKALVA